MSNHQDSLTQRLAEAMAEPSAIEEARVLHSEHMRLRREYGQEGLRAFGGIAATLVEAVDLVRARE